jgi:hypothetical protein
MLTNHSAERTTQTAVRGFHSEFARTYWVSKYTDSGSQTQPIRTSSPPPAPEIAAVEAVIGALALFCGVYLVGYKQVTLRMRRVLASR